MGKIGVHLDNDVGPVREGPAEAVHIRQAQSAGADPVPHVHPAGRGGGQFVGQVSRAVGRGVIDNEQSQLRHGQGQQLPHQGGKIARLVESGDHDNDLRRRPPFARIIHQRRPTSPGARMICMKG